MRTIYPRRLPFPREKRIGPALKTFPERLENRVADRTNRTANRRCDKVARRCRHRRHRKWTGDHLRTKIRWRWDDDENGDNRNWPLSLRSRGRQRLLLLLLRARCQSATSRPSMWRPSTSSAQIGLSHVYRRRISIDRPSLRRRREVLADTLSAA